MNRRLRTTALIALFALLAGCSMVRIAYNNADVAARVLMQEYFDLWREDLFDLRVQIGRLHDWHRREEMPRYAALAQSAADRLARGLAREDLDWAVAQVRERYRAFAVQASGEAVPVLVTFGPDHHAALAKKLADNNLKFAKEFLGDDPAKNERARAKRLIGNIEDFTGSLTDAQQARVTRFIAAFPRIPALQLASRQARQQELLALLAAKRSAAELTPALRDYFLDWDKRRSAEYARMAQSWEAELVAMLLDIERSLTPEQRARAVKKLAAYAEDFRALAREKETPGTRADAPSTRPNG